MATVSSDLDKIQARLHDSGTLWTRAELLRLFNDGYRQLMAQSGAFSRIMPLDVPGRHTYSCLYQWEDRHVTGTYWFPALTNFGSSRQATSAWEVELLEGLTPTRSLQAITAQWERAHSGDVQAHYEFGLPKEHERVRRLAWDDKLLIPVAVREFDEVDDAWMRRVGEPTWWTTGVGRSRTVEVYEIKTDYNQGWALELYENGIPRLFTGRTYAVIAADRAPGNSYSYTTSGDSHALSTRTVTFDPSSLYSTPADKDNAPTSGGASGPMMFTLAGDNYSEPNTWGTQVWEVSTGTLTGTARAIHPWESEFDAGGLKVTMVQQSAGPPSISGLGWRFTFAATPTSLGFGTFQWEEDHLEAATLRTSVVAATYYWENEFGGPSISFGVGLIRGATSPDRQYLPIVTDATVMSLLGSARDWRSTEDALSALEVVIPQQDLAETDEPELIPDQVQKYIRYYVLSRAFGREGEGQKAEMAAHYEARFKRGVALMRRLADVAHKDRMYVRDMPSEAPPRPPLVRLPSEFPRVF